MTGKCHVIIVEHMRGNAVDERGVGWGKVAARRNLRRTIILRRGSTHRGDDADRLLGCARNHYAEAIDDAGAGSLPAPIRKIGWLEARDEIRGLARDIEHGRLLKYAEPH